MLRKSFAGRTCPAACFDFPNQGVKHNFMLKETWIKKIISELCVYQKQYENVFSDSPNALVREDIRNLQ